MKWNPDSAPPNVTAHKTVGFVCEQLAYEVFEQLRYDNEFNAFIKEHNLNEKSFAKHYAAYFRKAARALLTKQLTDPLVPEAQKADVMEALTLDQLIPRGGTSIVHKNYYK